MRGDLKTLGVINVRSTIKRKQYPCFNLLLSLIFLEPIGLFALPQPARSQTESAELLPIQTEAFDAPPGDEAPGSTAGGGSRSLANCLDADAAIELTVLPDARPSSLSIAFPETSARAFVVKIEDEHEHLLYFDTLTIDRAPGTLNISLPETASSLEVGKQYKWIVSAICGESLAPDDPIIEGLLTPMPDTQSSSRNIDSRETLQ